jgi:hypothetical protein
MDPADVSLVNQDDQDGTNIVLELVPDRQRSIRASRWASA